MFCPNCGNNVSENEDFCANCGTSLKEFRNESNVSEEQTMAERMAQQNGAFLKEKSSKLKDIIIKYKKQEAIGLGVIAVFIVVISLYSIFFGFEKLSWDTKYPDYSLEYVSPTNVKLGLIFSDKSKLKDLKYETTCGKLENNDLEINWDLRDVTGKCEVTVSYKSKKLKKEYNVVSTKIEAEELALEYNIDINSDEDLDFDGFTNKEETNLGTNPLVNDTDMDGLDDYYEVNTSKTDPLKKDTDDDGLNDFDEIELGLDPLKADSKGDGIKDGNRTLNYSYTNENLTIDIEGQGNIASLTGDINSNTKISSKTGLIDKLYTFHTEGKINKATVTIFYTEEELEKYNLNEDELSIYYYNIKEDKYELVNTTIDKENKKLTATLTHFSNYVIGDKTKVKEKTDTEVLLVLDNSWSMYSDEQYKEITGETYSSLFGTSDLGSDIEGKRFSLSQDLVSKFSQKNYKIGLSEFRSDYANAIKIGTDYKNIKNTLSNMNGNFITKVPGTYIGNALKEGIKEFNDSADNKYIIILTDGEDTSFSNFEMDVIEKANEKNVHICSVGFSAGSNSTTLSNISNATGCKYFASSDVSGLTELFDNLEVEINNDLVDIDDDGVEDGILLADSGFVVNKNGFSFENYSSNYTGGHCFGMATFAELYYRKSLPLNTEDKEVGDSKAFGYNLNRTHFKTYESLYDYKLQSNALKYAFGHELFGEVTPAAVRALKENVLGYEDTYRKEIEATGIYDIEELKTSIKKDEQIKKYGVSYKTFEQAYLNEDKLQSSYEIKTDDKELLNAIYYSYLKQSNTTFYSSGSDFVLWLRNVIGTEKDEYPGADSFIDIIKTRLKDKDPIVISSNYSNGLHSINAINLIQDIENPNHYYIGVYDNNYPGEKRYIDIECKKDSCVSMANSYYSNSNQPIRITPSLEYDLEYYK